MIKQTIDTMGEFFAMCHSADLFSGNMLYRGQGTEGSLIPGIARFRNGDTADLEKKMLKQLRLQGASMIRSPDAPELELMVLAQHYGMRTRLLDWTSNPLAALWFACTSRAEGDVFLYSLDADEFYDADVYKEDPFKHKRTIVFQPRLDNHRILAQSGWFTLHFNTGKKFTPLEKHAVMSSKLTEFRVAGDKRRDMIDTLSRMGVNRKSLFPDVEGLCSHLNFQHGVHERPTPKRILRSRPPVEADEARPLAN